MPASLTLTSGSYTLGIKDIRDPSASMSAKFSTSGSLTGSKILQVRVPTVPDPGNQFACAVLLDDYAQHVMLKAMIMTGEITRILLSSGTLPISEYQGVFIDYTYKILHPSNWVEATLTFELI